MKRLGVFSFCLFTLFFTTATTWAQLPSSQEYTRVNLVSDIAGVARFADPNLVNPWGLVSSATSPRSLRPLRLRAARPLASYSMEVPIS